MTRNVTRLLLPVALVAAALVGPLAGTAAAHGEDASAASNYRTRILSVTPEIEGIEIDVIDVGGRLQLTNRTDTEVMVLGYEGEPYLRVGPEGVFVYHDANCSQQHAWNSIGKASYNLTRKTLDLEVDQAPVRLSTFAFFQGSLWEAEACAEFINNHARTGSV